MGADQSLVATSEETPGWKGPDLPIWQGLALVAVLVLIGVGVTLVPVPNWVALCAAVFAIAVTARWWRPWLRGLGR